MVTYQIPLETYPDTHNEKPLMYAALASQKSHMAVYLMGTSTWRKKPAASSKQNKGAQATATMSASGAFASEGWRTCPCP